MLSSADASSITIAYEPACATESPPPLRSPSSLTEAAQRFIDMRNACAPLLPRSMMRDISWDLLLELFIDAEQGVSPFIKQLRSIAGEPLASATRRIDTLEENGLLRRRQNDDDHRRVHVSLTAKGHRAIANMLAHLYDFTAATPALPFAGATVAAPRSFAPAQFGGG